VLIENSAAQSQPQDNSQAEARPGKIPLWLVRALSLSGALVVVAFSGWYAPWITASSWHIFHPRGAVEYRGLHIEVPWPWIADTETVDADPTATPQGLSLRKLPPNMLRPTPPQSIFVTVISPDAGVTPEEQTRRWLAIFRDSHPGASFDSATPVPLPAGASCLSADVHARPVRAKPNDVLWSCISVDAGWVANFEGHARDEAAFFRVVRGLRR